MMKNCPGLLKYHLFVSALFLVSTASVMAQQKEQLVTMPFGDQNKIVYNLQTGTYTVFFNGKETIKNAYALCKGNEAHDSRSYTQRSYTATAVNNGFGKGMLYTISGAGDNKLQQLFYVFPQKNYCITALRLSGNDNVCNYMSPVTADNVDLSDALGQPYIISVRSAPDRSIQQKGDNRALFVPFDNDMWVRYNAAAMSKADFTGSEVAAFYDNNSNRGIIIGSLEHGVWKSAIQVHASSDTTLDRLTVFAGFTDSITTHDKVPHGKVKPMHGYCASPLVMMGSFSDWRNGMETYAALNRIAEPRKIVAWNKPAPIGWNSWGAIQDKLTLDKAKSVVDFFHDSCKAFRTADHTLYIDLDSYWDNMTKGGIGGDVSQLKTFVQYCRQKGFQPGVYWAPFVDWGKTERKIEGSDYSYSQSWTTQNGHTIDTDGGRAMDPTFPGTKDRIVYFINRLKELGFRMIKIDFLGHAAAETDKFYDPDVTTGMQAFRKGMEFLDSVLDNKMLVYAAISPNLATARYVHMRRIGCDAFSAIDNTEYTLNSTGYGWWQSSLYDYIDADHVVFGNGPENINRARLTSSIITGTLMTGDDYSATGTWRSIAIKLLQNQQVLLLAKQVKRFRPVEANTGNKAVNIFEKHEGGDVYIAVINYDAAQRTFVIPLERIGMKASDSNWQAQELFSGRTMQGKGNIPITVNGSDAVIYRVLDK